MKKKIVSVILTAVLGTTLLTGCGGTGAADTSSADSAQSEDTETSGAVEKEGETGTDSAAERDEGAVLRIAGQSSDILFAPIAIADEKGYLEEELAAIGATYEWSTFESGPAANEAVAAGEADISYMADLPAIVAKSSGMNLELIAGLGLGEKTTAVLVPKDSDIKSVADLKGKTIGYLFGTYNQHLLALLLEQEGLTLDDVESINLTNQDHETALLNGDIDASVTCDPNLTKFKNDDTVTVLADGQGIKRSNMVVYSDADYAAAHPLVIQALIKALDRAVDYIENNKEEAVNLIAERSGQDPANIEEIIEGMIYTTDLTQDDIDEIEKVKNFSLDNEIITNDFDINDFINTTYLEAVRGNE